VDEDVVKSEMRMQEIIGWVSSLILVLTIGKQVFKQWQDGVSEGVSLWLFVGQMAASVGFSIYSFMLKNWVFVTTNLLTLLAGLVGLVILIHHRRNPRPAEAK